MSDKPIPYNGPARYDDRRNTSQVFGVPADALPNALKALSRHRDQDWYKWIVARQNGEHLHGSIEQRTGKPALCPVQGCLL